MIDREGLEISQKNVYDGVFSKVTYSLQTATLLSRDFSTDLFRSMYRKLAVLKRIF